MWKLFKSIWTGGIIHNSHLCQSQWNAKQKTDFISITFLLQTKDFLKFLVLFLGLVFGVNHKITFCFCGKFNMERHRMKRIATFEITLTFEIWVCDNHISFLLTPQHFTWFNIASVEIFVSDLSILFHSVIDLMIGFFSVWGLGLNHIAFQMQTNRFHHKSKQKKKKNSHQIRYSNWFWPFRLSMLSSKYCVSNVFISIIFALSHGFTIPRIILNLNNNDADLFHSFTQKFDYNRNDLKTSAEHKNLGIRQASHHYLTEQMMSHRF